MKVKVTPQSVERVDSIDLSCYLGSCYFQGVEQAWEVPVALDGERGPG